MTGVSQVVNTDVVSGAYWPIIRFIRGSTRAPQARHILYCAAPPFNGFTKLWGNTARLASASSRLCSCPARVAILRL